MSNTFGEQMHLMGRIEALLKLEVEIMAKRQELERDLADLKNLSKAEKD